MPEVINDAMRDLQDVSVYCEKYVEFPIDAIKRYVKPSEGRKGLR